MGWMFVVAPVAIVAVILLWVGATLWADRSGNWRASRRKSSPQRGEVAGGTHVGDPASTNKPPGPDAEEVSGETVASPAAKSTPGAYLRNQDDR